jgi:hypoxanthine phosphoribosyltransferase
MSHMGTETKDFRQEVLIGREEIRERVAGLAKEISADYKGKKPLFVGILKGSFIFLADLIREIDPGIGPQVDFMEISSYGAGKESSGQPKINKDLSIPIGGRDVIIVEDIVDTGYSFKALLAILGSRRPASLKTCALLSKPGRREVEVPIDYLGFTIKDEWVEGYGLDTDQDYRGLPDVVCRKEIG